MSPCTPAMCPLTEFSQERAEQGSPSSLPSRYLRSSFPLSLYSATQLSAQCLAASSMLLPTVPKLILTMLSVILPQASPRRPDSGNSIVALTVTESVLPSARGCVSIISKCPVFRTLSLHPAAARIARQHNPFLRVMFLIGFQCFGISGIPA